MEFEKDARKSGVFNLISGIVVLGGAVAMQVIFFNKPDADVSVMGMAVMWLIAGVLGLLFTGMGIALIRSGGSWKIVINEAGVSWESPNESVDRSFNLKMSEIERVETRVRPRKGKTSSSRRYFLITHSGQEQKLSPNSGINLPQVVITLERLGVKSETVSAK